MFLAFDSILLLGKGLFSLLFGCVFVFVFVALVLLLFERGRDRKRLWIHQQIAHMKCRFLIATCAVVIVVPTVLFNVGDCVFFTSTENPLTNSFLNAIAGNAPEAKLDYSGVFYVLVSLLGYLVFSGFTVAMFTSMLHHKMSSISNGEELYKNLNNHIVIIGSGRFLIPLVEKLLNDGDKAVESKTKFLSALKEIYDIWIGKGDKYCQIVILSSEPIPELRKRLSASLVDKAMKKVILIHGNRINREYLDQLCLPNCKEIYLMGDSDEADLDDRNIESLTQINKVLNDKKSKSKKCKIYLERYHTYSLFQVFIKETKLTHLDLEPICFYKHWAEVVLGIRNRIPQNNNGQSQNIYPKLDGDSGIGPSSEKFVHLVVIGMSRMGMSLVTEAAMHLHFPNSDKKRTRITMIDLNARKEMYKFVNLNQNLFNEAYYTYTEYTDTPFGGWPSKFSERNATSAWLDTEFHFVQGNVESNDVRELLGSFAIEKDACLTVAVCLPDARYALSVALSLPHVLYNRPNVSILVQQEVGEGLLNLLGQQGEQNPNYSNVRPFGMINEEIGSEAEFEKFAPYVSIVYDSSCKGEQTWESLETRLEDPRLLRDMYSNWEVIQPWERISNRYAALAYVYKVRSLFSFVTKENKEVFGRMEHNRWCVEKLLNGFRTLTKEEIDSPEYFEKREDWKKERFAHYGICRWDEVCQKKEIDPRFKSFYWNSINMGMAICRLPDIEKIILRWEYSFEENVKTLEYNPMGDKSLGELCMCDGWGTKLVTEYSEEGKMTKEMWLGSDEKPCLNNEGVAEIRYEYDQEGKKTKESYYDEKGNCIGTKSL